MPAISPTMSEGGIVAWKVKEGELVVVFYGEGVATNHNQAIGFELETRF